MPTEPLSRKMRSPNDTAVQRTPNGRSQAVGPRRGVFGQSHQSQYAEPLCLCPETPHRGPASRLGAQNTAEQIE
ncbi:hypothetical protein Y032_0227g2818 [Ancylostoma ceylanicum]|uniref:Uncharacterized protein n=1 Tax=Ancylostoma ceylanicum TaxID=53326 RepID=A0A016SHJ6_9BILA|nr:hypothetical protein Y032_0227g2818 [Ancylostoma ceylanicum]